MTSNFVDYVKIFCRSGNGGAGCMHLLHAAKEFKGGPDGGDGGDGGSVYLEVDPGLNTLSEFRHNHHYSAGAGENGKKKRMAGKKGADLTIYVPEGTLVKEAASDKVIVDMSGASRPFGDVAEGLAKVGESLGLQAKCQKEEIFEKMHRI